MPKYTKAELEPVRAMLRDPRVYRLAKRYHDARQDLKRKECRNRLR